MLFVRKYFPYLFLFTLMFAPASYATPPHPTSFGGKVYGGQQPISGSHVYLYQPGTPTTTGTSSQSILTSATGGTADSNGHYYVTTVANGAFTITSSYYTCTLHSPVYAYSVGGDPGAGANSAIGLLGYLACAQQVIQSSIQRVVQ